MPAFPRPLVRGALWFVLVAVPLLSGCASRMSNMWRDETFRAPAMVDKNSVVCVD